MLSPGRGQPGCRLLSTAKPSAFSDPPTEGLSTARNRAPGRPVRACLTALGVLGSCIAGLLFAVFRTNDGRFVYTFDDAYIHLALAENLSEGHYGVNLGESSSPSSSPLWPVLIVPFRWLGLDAVAPLIIGIGALVGLTVLVASWVSPLLDGTRGRAGWLGAGWVTALVVLSTNALALVFTGLEHPLQVLLVAAIVVGLARHQSAGRLPFWTWMALVLAPLVRYEALAVSLPALVVLCRRGLTRPALGAGALTLALLGGFGLFLVSQGLGPFPASVAAKSALPLLVSQPSEWLQGFGERAVSMQGIELLALGLVLAALASTSERGSIERQLGALGAAVPLAHLVAGEIDWYGRYAAYAWTAALLVTLRVARKPLGSLFSRAPVRSVFGATLALGLVRYGALANVAQVPLASNNIYEQQFQMHRLVTEFVRGPVAVNDLGWVSYENPQYVLDLWGLASPGALQARRAGDTHALGALARRHRVVAALVYAHWFPEFPPSFLPVAVLRLGKPVVTPAGSAVTVYAVGTEAQPRVLAALDAFAPTLPAGVRLERLSAR